MRLIAAIQPDRTNNVRLILGDCDDVPLVEVAHVFGVSESTVENDWIPSGVPVGRNEDRR